MDISFIGKQQAKYNEILEGPEIVPSNIFLPKDRDAALYVVKSLLYYIRKETLRNDYVTGASNQIGEVLDLIERS